MKDIIEYLESRGWKERDYRDGMWMHVEWDDPKDSDRVVRLNSFGYGEWSLLRINEGTARLLDEGDTLEELKETLEQA